MYSLLFWISLLIISYTFVGYPLFLWMLNALSGKNNKLNSTDVYAPLCTLIIPAYNEEQVIEQKITNTLSLDYPADKLKITVVADGSTDNTTNIAKKHKEVELLHSQKRLGKTHAMLRAASQTSSDIIIFSDANTLLSVNAIKELVRFFKDPQTGCVAGEKSIVHLPKAHSIQASEGLYWQWEGFIKKQESAFHSTMGAAGELFAIRKDLIVPLKDDTILDDFLLSMHVAEKNKRVRYAPGAVAREKGSASRKDEMERKIRIAAGAFQALGRIQILKQPFRYPREFWQLLSHKLLRWLFVPWLLVVLLISNSLLIMNQAQNPIYLSAGIIQLLFYTLAFISIPFQNKKSKYGWLFFPGYFLFMNAAIVLGAVRFFRKQQSAAWTRVQRGSGMLF